LFAWEVIGRKPQRATVGQLFKEFMKFTDLRSLLKKPSVAAAAKAFFKTYLKVLNEVLDEKESKWGFVVGSAYSLMDEATDARKTRKLSGTSKARRNFIKGFMAGYGEMRAHLARFGNDTVLRRLLKRLAAVEPQRHAVRHIYRALHEVTVAELNGADELYFFARKNRTFGYPRFAIRKP